MGPRPFNRSASPEEPAAISDPALLRRVEAGELVALGLMYDRHHARLRHFVARATCDAPDVDDLVHETFLAAAESASRYDGRESCRPWLVGIAVTLLRRRNQRFGRFLRVLSTLGSVGSGAADMRPALDARHDVTRALAQLSDAKRLTLLMAELEGLSCQEIATLSRVPVGTVWTRLHAARRELRAAMSEGDER